ncbi:ferric-dicitrate binding protein FerR (iron transport regulator) [Chitinophaga dinghuensis]|uniref:Ferric-dicitrate binding protein FerR (Iron transport regulator) n=1 Tax=Chitinophaga dinghuensis TaxID=1539050 RepID=A0A327VSN9_9BACT|nr:FecR family protein [Chitinophaga dinghuensis]RAJ77434.1 ferric-dicitrate binding protein FerR (iron transport regulator) [Chitinophaga dinghuensis]
MENRKAYLQQLLHSDKWSLAQWNWIREYLESADLSELQAVAEEDFQMDLQQMRSTLDRKLSRQMLRNIHRRAGIKESGFRGIFRMYPRRVAAAAGLLLVCAATWFWMKPLGSDMLAINADNERKTLTLPDSSVVQLERGSVIKYAKSFGKTNRTLDLQGEAFFDVKNDAAHPFIINSKVMKTTVLGTAFNMDVDNDSLASVVVISGSVQVVTGNLHDAKQPGTVLTANKKLVLNTISNQYQIADGTADARFYEQKKAGIFLYEEETVANILSDLERLYNLSLKASPDILQQRIKLDVKIDQNVRIPLEYLAALYQARLVALADGKGYMLESGNSH